MTGTAHLEGVSSAGHCLVRCTGVWKRFGELTVLNDVSLEVRRGEVVCVVGPSGGGKSTLLRAINGLESIDAGNIEVAGIGLGSSASQLRRVRGRVGMVFQSFNLFPHLTIRRNLSIGPHRTLGISHKDAAVRADRLAARVGLADQLDKHPGQLSGGQQQRIAIARALCMEPQLILFDEPTSSLDPESVSEVLNVMAELAATQTTMIVVTHEMGFARQAADRIIFMDRGEIACDLPPTQFFEGAQLPRLRKFLDSILR